MITIDGGAKSGSGTIVRCTVALSSLLGEELELKNIRAKRAKPGLRAQHLVAILACKGMCGAVVEDAAVGSSEIRYKPQMKIEGGKYEWDIGTAGSTTMLAQTLLPLACFADKPSVFRLEGGLFQDFAPSAYHMQFVLLPLLSRMGIQAELRIIRPGYVPKGGGVIELVVEPLQRIKSLSLLEQGEIGEIRGTALSSHLAQRKVSHRMAYRCKEALASYGYEAKIDQIYDTSAHQEGAALAIYAETNSGGRIGSDRAGRPGRSSESIGSYVAQALVEDIDTGATVDRYSADQLIIYAALAHGSTRYLMPRMTEHIETNLWLVGELLGSKTKLQGNLIEIEGISFER